MTERMLAPGDMVPELHGELANGDRLSLTDLRGKPVVVYFYPKDNTSGCTREAQDFRDLYPAFQKLGCEVIGVSRDSAASHARFAARHALPFPLVADTDETWCKAFGVLGEKVLYGRRFIGLIRSTFLIGADGVLGHAWRKVKVPGHAAAVLARLTAA
ncbi:peroxiredoxin [Dokdonella sp.]|uniref:peroxiredoxin n=1 Tax=Dokdonella sp. TaxID=2291710 RepID=UPI0031BCCF3D|nr:peroxiredoxin [Dokdonella sp.]